MLRCNKGGSIVIGPGQDKALPLPPSPLCAIKLRMPYRRFILPLLFALPIAACAAKPVPWVNPELPRERAEKDFSACRRWADNQIDPDRSAEGRLADGSPFRPADRSDARQQINSLVASCMHSKGYKAATAR